LVLLGVATERPVDGHRQDPTGAGLDHVQGSRGSTGGVDQRDAVLGGLLCAGVQGGVND